MLEQTCKLNVFHSGGRAFYYWLDVFAASRPSRGGSHEKTAALSYTFMGKQEGHGRVYVRTQGSSQRRYTGIKDTAQIFSEPLRCLLRLEAPKCMYVMLFFVFWGGFLDCQGG